MSALPVLEPLTYDDLLAMPDDGQRYEILLGELVVTASPTPAHVAVWSRIAARLTLYVDDHDLGTFYGSEVDVRFGMHDILAPDMCFVAKERSHIAGGRLVEGAPDLVIEVLSPSTRRYDLIQKRAVYASGGVREYWIVDPEAKRVKVLAFDGGHTVEIAQPGDRVVSRVFPELELRLADVFR